MGVARPGRKHHTKWASRFARNIRCSGLSRFSFRWARRQLSAFSTPANCPPFRPPSTGEPFTRQLSNPPRRASGHRHRRQLASPSALCSTYFVYIPHATPCIYSMYPAQVDDRQLAPPSPQGTRRSLFPSGGPPPCARRCRTRDGRVKYTNLAKDRADAQRLVATRLLDRLHDPLGHFSRLQRIYPRAR